MPVARQADTSMGNVISETTEKPAVSAGIPLTNQNSTVPLTEKPATLQPPTTQQEMTPVSTLPEPVLSEKTVPAAPPEHLLTTQRLLNEKALPVTPSANTVSSSKPKMPQMRRSESERHAEQLAAWPPTPLVSAEPISEDEEEVISDRTPEQARMDADLEMSEAQPAVPIAPRELAPHPPPPEIRRQSTDRPGLKRGEASSIVNTAPPPVPASTPMKNQSLSSIAEPQQKWLLPAMRPEHRGRKCLVLDLDETLVHSSFKVSNKFRNVTSSSLTLLQILHQADFTIPVEIEGAYHNVYVIKRPGVDQFMKRVGELYEVVVFTASVSKVSFMISLSCEAILTTSAVW